MGVYLKILGNMYRLHPLRRISAESLNNMTLTLNNIQAMAGNTRELNNSTELNSSQASASPLNSVARHGLQHLSPNVFA